MKVLIVAEHKGAALAESSLELLGLPLPPDTQLEAALVGEDCQEAAQQLAARGVVNVHCAQQPELAERGGAEAWTDVLTHLIQTTQPNLVVAAHTYLGRDVMPRLAARLDAALVTDCTHVAYEEGVLRVRRPLYAGKATAAVEFLAPGLRLLTIRPRALKAPDAMAASQGMVREVTVHLGEAKTRLKQRVQGEAKRPDVTEAAIVVSGGRSLKAAENFRILEDLADQLGAAVGASRAAVDSGYRPYRDQVGQTGKVVSPQVYIACGISGAIQHLAGMRTSKNIIAINSDQEAPIFQVADYGVVGDLFQIVPAMVKVLQEN